MYIKLTNEIIEKYPYSVDQLRRDNPQTSFPANPPLSLLAEWGVFPVSAVTPPIVDHTKTVAEGQPQLIEGAWTQVWTVSDVTPESLTLRIAEESTVIRQQRNNLLANSDWTQLPDAPVDKSAWAVYRQSLRDLTSQLGFPWTVTWPTPPD